MDMLEAARRLAQLGETEEARKAYRLVLEEGGDPARRLEGALYILQSGGDYKISYTALLELYQEGAFQAETLGIMTQAFYQPNERALKARYDKNCKALAKYPYLERRDFVPFDRLPIQFFPYDDQGYLPFYREEARFGGYVDVKDPVVSRNFFRDLDEPVLAADVYSQYELEYLNDNVRSSEDAGRENHIYLRYGDWGTFCAWLQVLDLRPLLKSKKFVFLTQPGEREYQNFRGRFEKMYQGKPGRAIQIREVNRLIWHAQLSTHNGGDFFNEVFDGHPNLLTHTSLMMDNVEESVSKFLTKLAEMDSLQQAQEHFSGVHPSLVEQLYHMPDRTEKDVLVAIFLNSGGRIDPNSRIVPAVFFQPHFENIFYDICQVGERTAVLRSEQAEALRQSPIFQGFKYIKTFLPMRRPTNSYGATIRFMRDGLRENQRTWEAGGDNEPTIIADMVTKYVLNRSFMVGPGDRLYRDSRLVRFEDGKLNPEATFRALAAFLDLPYTESMTYCSYYGERLDGPEGSGDGFDPGSVYRTYDGFANDAERRLIEYFCRDVYEYYGYDFQFWDGRDMDREEIQKLLGELSVIDGLLQDSWEYLCQAAAQAKKTGRPVPAGMAEAVKTSTRERMEEIRETRQKAVELLDQGLCFTNDQGQPMTMMTRLEPVPELLERPLYR